MDKKEQIIFLIGAILELVKKGFGLYECIRGRDTGNIVFKHCNKLVYTFVTQQGLDGPCKRGGICGTVKDHHRIYCCQEGYHQYCG